MPLRLLLSLSVLVAGCGLVESWRTERPRQANRQLSHPGTPRMAAGDIPEGSPRLASEIASGPKLAELPADQPGLVVLVVVDTVRADHLSACGYARPTSPMIEKLVEKGAALSCNAIAPATWTLPSHASFFTGAEVERHGMLRKGVALPEDLPTIAELYGKRGYQTVLVSANPLLKKPTGLNRGFHRAQVSAGLVGNYRAAGLLRIVRYELAQIDPTRPLFLVINIFDAHEPYPEIPAGVSWAEPQPPLYFHNPAAEGPGAYERFVAGDLPDAERSAWLADVVDGYDRGVSVADDSLGKLIQLLDRHELGKHGVRLVVTSDHGENLGEHGTVRHDGPPWEGVARVPLLYWDSLKKGGVSFPEVVSANVVFSLLAEGRLPEVMPEVRSGAIHYGTSDDPRLADAAALWLEGRRKLWWWPDARHAMDLGADPNEGRPLPLSPSEDERVRALGAALQAAKAKALAQPLDAKLGGMLEKLGYTEPGEVATDPKVAEPVAAPAVP